MVGVGGGAQPPHGLRISCVRAGAAWAVCPLYVCLCVRADLKKGVREMRQNSGNRNVSGTFRSRFFRVGVYTL